jgi:hypothetical protein
MACVLASSYSFLGCKGGAGGIKAVYITEFGNLVTQPTVTASTYTITAMTLSTGKKFWTYDLGKEMGFFTNPGTYTPTSGTISYEPEINFTIKTLADSVTYELHNVAQNTLLMIVRDVNDNYWLFGLARGMDMVTWTSQTGTAITDLAGYICSFKGKEIAPIYKVTSTLMTALTTPAP